MKAKARRQPTIAARAIASAGLIASFGLALFDNKLRSSAELSRRCAFVQRHLRAAAPSSCGREISEAARSGR